MTVTVRMTVAVMMVIVFIRGLMNVGLVAATMLMIMPTHEPSRTLPYAASRILMSIRSMTGSKRLQPFED